MESSVFGMSSLTSTSVGIPDAGNDNHINIKGSAGKWTSINSDAFLPQPSPGADQTYVKGNQSLYVKQDRRNKVVGDTITNIDGQLTTNILNGESRDVKIGRKTTIATLDNHRINGQRIVNVNGTNMRTVMGSNIITTVGAKTINEVSSWFVNEGLVKVKYGVVNVQLYPVKAEVLGLKAGAQQFKKEATLINTKVVGLKLATGLLALLLVVSRPKIGVVKPDTGGVHSHMPYIGV